VITHTSCGTRDYLLKMQSSAAALVAETNS